MSSKANYSCHWRCIWSIQTTQKLNRSTFTWWLVNMAGPVSGIGAPSSESSNTHRRPWELLASKAPPTDLESRSSQNQSTSDENKGHKYIEARYRTRLNDRFRRLLAILERLESRSAYSVDINTRHRAVTKGMILTLASDHILELEAQNLTLQRQINQLSQKMIVNDRKKKSLGQ